MRSNGAAFGYGAGEMTMFHVKRLAICLALTGCASTPVIVTQRVTVPQFVPVPADLLSSPDLVYPAGATWGQVEGIEYQGLQACRGQLEAIGKIQGTQESKPSQPPF